MPKAGAPYRKYNLQKNFGLSVEEYDEKIKNQNNVCAICGEAETAKAARGGATRRLAVDHNHNTGRVRDLLCRSCNMGLGNFKDSSHKTLKAYLYLLKWDALEKAADVLEYNKV